MGIHSSRVQKGILLIILGIFSLNLVTLAHQFKATSPSINQLNPDLNLIYSDFSLESTIEPQKLIIIISFNPTNSIQFAQLKIGYDSNLLQPILPPRFSPSILKSTSKDTDSILILSATSLDLNQSQTDFTPTLSASDSFIILDFNILSPTTKTATFTLYGFDPENSLNSTALISITNQIPTNHYSLGTETFSLPLTSTVNPSSNPSPSPRSLQSNSNQESTLNPLKEPTDFELTQILNPTPSPSSLNLQSFNSTQSELTPSAFETGAGRLPQISSPLPLSAKADSSENFFSQLQSFFRKLFAWL